MKFSTAIKIGLDRAGAGRSSCDRRGQPRRRRRRRRRRNRKLAIRFLPHGFHGSIDRSIVPFFLPVPDRSPMNIHARAATYAEHPRPPTKPGREVARGGRLSSYFPDRGSFLFPPPPLLHRFPVFPTAPSSDSYVPTGPFN